MRPPSDSEIADAPEPPPKSPTRQRRYADGARLRLQRRRRAVATARLGGRAALGMPETRPGLRRRDFHPKIDGSMKTNLHPEYHEVLVHCACGETWTTRSTKKELRIEICSKCHPFFTGKQKLVDSAGRVERFRKRYERKAAGASS